MNFKRVFLIVLDSMGVGEARDANDYNDSGANTLGHIKENYDLFVPNLKKLGFLNTLTMEDGNTEAYYTIAKPENPGKDTLNGHYEMVGVRNHVPFKNFNDTGFPRELIDEIELVTGKRIIGNKSMDEAEVLNDFAPRHMNYGSLILYTSNGSNLIIAANEDIVPVSKLYSYCEKIRKITLREDWKVGRVIAKPFTSLKNGKFKFTNEEKSFAVKPPTRSVLNSLTNNDYNVISIGKINDIFDGEGISKNIKATNTLEATNKLTDIMDKKFNGLCFVNLPDFDSLYGHKRDLDGYARAIEEFDIEIPMIINKLENDDLLIITADHGCDPTFQGTDHTRENVPVIIFGRNFKEPKKLEPLETFADIGATIAENFDIEKPLIGKSFLDKLK